MAKMSLSMSITARDSASGTFRRLSQTMRAGQTTAQRLGSTLGRTALRFATFGRMGRRASRDIDYLSNSMGRAENRAGRLKRSLMGAFTGGALAMGGGMAMAKIGGIAATTANYEASIDKVAAVANIRKGSSDYKMLDQQAKDLGASTAFSASQAAEGQQYLAMAGFKPKEIKQTMPGLLDLAKAGDTDLATTSDISSNILSGFGMQAGEMGRLGDVLASTFTTSNVNLQMLGETMKYVAPVASQMGASVEEVAAMTGLLGNVGIQGSMAGTTLRSLYSRMAAPPKSALDAMKKIGLSTKKANGELKSMPELLTEIGEKTTHLSKDQQAEIYKGIAGQYGLAGMMELVGQARSGGLDTYLKSVTGNDGRSRMVAKQMSDNLKGDLTALGSIKEGLQITMGELFMGDMRGGVQSITAMLKKLNLWVKFNPRIAKTIGLIVTTITGLAVVLGGLALFGPILAAAFSPVIIPIMAIAGGAAAIATNWDKLDGDLKFILNSMKRMLGFFSKDLFAFGKSLFKGDWAGVKQASENLKFDLQRLASYAWEGIEWASPKVDALFYLPEGTTLATIQAVWNPVKDFFEGFWSGLTGTFEPVSKSFSQAWGSIKGVAKAFGDLFDIVFGGEGNKNAEELGNVLGVVAGGGLKLFADTLHTAALAITGVVSGTVWLIDNSKRAFDWLDGTTRFHDWENAHRVATAEVQAHVDALGQLTGSREGAIAALDQMTEAERRATKAKIDAGLVLAEDKRSGTIKEIEKIFRGFGSGLTKTSDVRQLITDIRNKNVTSEQLLEFLNRYENTNHPKIVNSKGDRTENANRLYTLVEMLAMDEIQNLKLNNANNAFIQYKEQQVPIIADMQMQSAKNTAQAYATGSMYPRPNAIKPPDQEEEQPKQFVTAPQGADQAYATGDQVTNNNTENIENTTNTTINQNFNISTTVHEAQQMNAHQLADATAKTVGDQARKASVDGGGY